MKLVKNIVVLLVGCFSLTPAMASDFDGSKSLICATVEARDCVLGLGCYSGEAREIGAPSFLRIDFVKKTITGERTTSIASIEKSENQMLLQGTELGFGWVMAINQTNGYFSGSVTDMNGSFLLYGTCTLD